ncbi:MAG: hypothetical protein LAT84_08900 [Balneolia bacterium]|nr:hypothetical protein [Balneolia bacterium]
MSPQTQTDRIVSSLDMLRFMNFERALTYQHAALFTNNSASKIMFTRFARTSIQCRMDLMSEINRLGGCATESAYQEDETGSVNEIENASADGSLEQPNLYTCGQIEVKTAKYYRIVFSELACQLSAVQQQIIQSQFALLKANKAQITILLLRQSFNAHASHPALLLNSSF